MYFIGFFSCFVEESCLYEEGNADKHEGGVEVDVVEAEKEEVDVEKESYPDEVDEIACQC